MLVCQDCFIIKNEEIYLLQQSGPAFNGQAVRCQSYRTPVYVKG